jgi:hypothetical protein
VVDLFFLTSTVILFIIYHASIGTGAAAAIALMFLLSIAGHAIALIRFKHSAAVHSKMMKIYAVFAYVGFFFAWISGSLIPWVFIALAAGIIAEVERFWILIRSKTEPIDISTMADINHPIASLKTALFKKGDSSCS